VRHTIDIPWTLQFSNMFHWKKNVSADVSRVCALRDEQIRKRTHNIIFLARSSEPDLWEQSQYRSVLSDLPWARWLQSVSSGDNSSGQSRMAGFPAKSLASAQKHAGLKVKYRVMSSDVNQNWKKISIFGSMKARVNAIHFSIFFVLF
jgi:hypothetical protein